MKRALLAGMIATLPTMLFAALGTADRDGRLDLLCDGRVVLGFQHGVVPAPEGVDPAFARGGFVHPLCTPDGHVLTRIQPPDHRHHYGIWNPWTHVLYKGREYDMWNLGEKQGTVRFAGFESITDTASEVGFTAIQEHVIFDGKGGTIVLIRERQSWTMREPSPDGSIVLDMRIELTDVTDEPLTLEEYRYESLGWRATGDWDRHNSSVLSSGGHTRADADSTRAEWVLVQGDFADASHGGAALLSYKDNFNQPQPLRVWPEDMYDRGDVFVSFSPTKDRSWILEPGKPQVLRYRWIVFDGAKTLEDVRRWWAQYSQD